MIEKQLKGFYNQYKLLVWPICTTLASAVILVFVIIPQLLSYLNVRTQIGQLQMRVDSLDVKAQELQQLDGNKITQQFNSAFTVFPTDPQIPSALVVLQGLADNSGVKITSTTYATGQHGSSGQNSFVLDLTVDGSITQMRSFLTSLQSTTRIFQVTSISAHFTKNYMLEADIPIAVFYQPSSSVTWSVEQEMPTFSTKDEQFLSQVIQQVTNAQQETQRVEASYSAVPVGKLNPFN